MNQVSSTLIRCALIIEKCNNHHKDGDCDTCPLFHYIPLHTLPFVINLCPCELLSIIGNNTVLLKRMNKSEAPFDE